MKLDVELQARLDRLRAILVELRDVVVAYSGGVDSTLLAFVAYEQLGVRALACTASSPSMDADELDAAKRLADTIGIRHRVVATREVELEGYARNTRDRCYVCKRVVFRSLAAIAREEGLQWLVHGAQLDDAQDHRPGNRAALEVGVRAPLAEADLTKADVRALAHQFGLPNFQKPAAPCLSSRIPYGERVTVAKLQQVSVAEAALRALGFNEVRVRHHGTVARVEVAAGEIERLAHPEMRKEVVGAICAAGFTYVTLDLAGFRSGSLNVALKR